MRVALLMALMLASGRGSRCSSDTPSRSALTKCSPMAGVTQSSASVGACTLGTI
ncbi:peptidase M23 family protein [Synechococcus sp. BMK-MC-1]|nr:peptidase M23 family protein [Synechococcus sp. BMK-MC-1]